MTASWFVIQHVAWEGPGLIAAVAHARGLSVEVRRMDRADPLPAPDEVGGLVVMGGPMSVYDAASFPSLDSELALLGAMVERKRPVLGVCLGAQLLAAAMGARVYRGTAPEIGFGTVTLTAAGRADPVLGAWGDVVPVFHWHGDTFELPVGAVHLAASDAYRQQAFRAGPVYGFQFHVEVDRALVEAWAPHLQPGERERIDEARRLEVERVGRIVLGRFFDIALGAASGEAAQG